MFYREDKLTDDALYKIVQYLAAVLFQSIFAKYFLTSLYFRLWKCFLRRIILFHSPFTLKIKCIWLGSLHLTGSYILTLSTNSFCELKTMSNTFLSVLVLAHVVKGNHLVLNKIKTKSQYSVEMFTEYVHGKNPP